MARRSVQSLDADQVITIGGTDKKTKKANPTSAEGYYLGSRTTEGGKFGPSTLHFIQTSKGNVGVWGKTDLNKRLSVVKPGEYIWISYKGMKPTPNGDMHTYGVDADDENTIEVAGVSSNTGGSDSYVGDSDEDEVEEGEDEYTEEDFATEPEPAPRSSSVAMSASERRDKVQAALKAGRGRK